MSKVKSFSANTDSKNQGFTLVELSIVIVIIAFLIAGISTGESLVKQARISSLINDYTNYQILFTNFKTGFTLFLAT